MPKLTNVRERVHQPFRDTLIRTSGYFTSNLTDTSNLFQVAGKTEGETNLPNGSTLPSDQSMVVLALRAFTWFRHSIQRDTTTIVLPDGTTILTANGDWEFPTIAASANFANALNGQAIGNVNDVYRLHWQAEEQLLWSFGAGDKFSITSMPTAYFPYGGGLHGDLGGTTDLIHWNNGMPSHEGILRLARAILIPPRQNLKCQAQIARLVAAPNAATFVTTQGARDMLSLRDNLNAPDLINKVVSFTIDGLFSRDVQ
jgi:hypothetical protein